MALTHFAFVLFVVLGGLLAWRWRWVIWVHLPCVLWGALIEFTGCICPLTPLENRLRQASGVTGYQSGFIEHYLMPILYPAGLTRGIQIVLGIAVIVFNLVIYTWIYRRRANGTGPAN